MKQFFDEDGKLIEFMDQDEALYWVAANYIADPRPEEERVLMWSTFAKGISIGLIQITKDGYIGMISDDNETIEMYRVADEKVFGTEYEGK